MISIVEENVYFVVRTDVCLCMYLFFIGLRRAFKNDEKTIKLVIALLLLVGCFSADTEPSATAGSQAEFETGGMLKKKWRA